MSSGRLESRAIRDAFHTFRGYARDLIDATPTDTASIATRFSVFTTKLRLLVNFVEKDDVMRWVAQALHYRAGDVRDWFREAAAGRTPAIGNDPSKQIAHRYTVLHGIKRGHVDLRSLVSTLFGDISGGYTEAFNAFREAYINELIDRFSGVLGMIEGRLDEASVDFDAVVWDVLAELDAQAAKKRTKAARKTAAKGASKKKATRKKATRKKAARKKAARKKPAASRKSARKKTARKKTARKKTARKKTAKKKPARKKTASKRKTATKKRGRRK